MNGTVLIVNADGTLEGLDEVRTHLLSPGRRAVTANFLNALLHLAPADTQKADSAGSDEEEKDESEPHLAKTRRKPSKTPA